MKSPKSKAQGVQIKRLSVALFVGGFLLLSATSPARAWGSIGHRLIGQVADARLTPQAAARVSKIMGTNSLGDVANWMDQVRETPQGKRMKPWHYQSVSACDSAETVCKDDQCAGPQIENAIEALRSGKGNQLRALRVLAHLIGDIHQPLHAAENSDRGGNFVILENRRCMDFKTKTYAKCNLHTYWDNMLVKAAIGNQSEQEFVNSLQAASVNSSLDVIAWIAESNQLAKSTAHRYEGFACKAGANEVSLAEDYDEAAVKVVRAQLAAAGSRLAQVLNDLYK